MQRFRDFLKRKDIEISLRRYGIDALGAMAQGLFCSLLIGTILNTLGQQFPNACPCPELPRHGPAESQASRHRRQARTP